MDCANPKFMVKVVYNLQKEYIFFDKLSLDIFLDECTVVFKISTDDRLRIELFDHDGFRINPEKFTEMFSNYSRCGCFIVHLKVRIDSYNEPIITQYDLEKFLKERNAGPIFDKSVLEGDITEKERRTIIALVHDFLKIKCAKIEVKHKSKVAETLASLFPCLPKELIYNSKDGGWLGKRIKNSNAKTKPPVVLVVETNTSFEEDLYFLKTVVVSEESLHLVEAALVRTANKRKAMMRAPEMEYIEHFPWFFTNPELILFDFSRNIGGSTPTGLVDNWAAYSMRLRDILNQNYEMSIHTMWAKDIEDLLILLKLFPAKAVGRNAMSEITSFNKAIEKLIVFCENGKPPQEVVNATNIHPYIIACGESTKDISHYFIAVETNLINIPFEFSPVEVLDLLFKIHHVFNTAFEVNLKPMMSFLAHFIYGMDNNSFKPSLKMKNVHTKLIPK